MQLPSRNLRRFASKITGEKDFFAGVEKQLEISDEIKRVMEGKFGAVLYAAIEDMERTAFLGLANTSPLRIWKQLEYRKELRMAQYLKARIESHISNHEALSKNLETIYGGDDGEVE